MQSVEIHFHKQFNAFEYDISSYTTCETRRGAGGKEGRGGEGEGRDINSITILKNTEKLFHNETGTQSAAEMFERSYRSIHVFAMNVIIS